MKTLVFAFVAFALPGLIIFHLPLIPNSPIDGLLCIGFGFFAAAVAGVLIWPDFRPPNPVTDSWLRRTLPLGLAIGTVLWGYVRATSENFLCLQFSDALVLEKYRSRNHQYLSLRVEIAGRGAIDVEGITPGAFARIVVGDKVGKACGSREIDILSH